MTEKDDRFDVGIIDRFLGRRRSKPIEKKYWIKKLYNNIDNEKRDNKKGIYSAQEMSNGASENEVCTHFATGKYKHFSTKGKRDEFLKGTSYEARWK